MTCQFEKKHTWNWTIIILGIFHFQELYLCKQRETFVWVFTYVWGKVKSTLSGLQLLVFFTCILTFFENINQEHNSLPDCACLWTVYWFTGQLVFCEKWYVSLSVPTASFVLLAIYVLFRSVLNQNYLFIS